MLQVMWVMMKTRNWLLILIFTSMHLCGQVFKQYGATAFHYLASDKKLHGTIAPHIHIGRYTANGYIKKGDSLLIVSALDLDRFLAFFENTPSAFDSLFKKLPWIENKQANTDKFDKVLKQTTYKIHSDIGSIPVFINVKNNEVIWNLTNTCYLSASNSCYLNILFKLKNSSEIKIDSNNLEYIKVSADHCDY